MESGLNVATKMGEGQASVIDWSGFHNTLNQIYQRDINKHKEAQLAYDRSAMEVNKMAEGIRAEDTEDLRNSADAYKQASLMLMNPKIKRNSQESAKWQRAKDDAYFATMQIANESKKEAARQHALNAKHLQTNGAGFHENYTDLASEVSKLPTKLIKSKGLDNEGMYTVPKDPMKEIEIKKNIYGTKPVKIQYSKQADGYQQDMVIEHPENVIMTKNDDGSYTPNFSKVATKATESLLHNPNFRSTAKKDYLETQPEYRSKILLAAQKLSPDIEIADDPEHFFVAKSIVEASQGIRETKEGGLKAIPATFEEKTKVAKEKATTQFNRSLQKMGYGASLREKVAAKGVTPEAVQNETSAIFERAKKQGKEVDVNGKKMYLTSEYEEENKKHPVKVGSDAKGDILKPAPLVAVDEDGTIHQLQSKKHKGVESLTEVGTGISQEKVFDRVANTMLKNKGITAPKSQDSSLSPEIMNKVRNFMKKNKISSESEAIRILKENKKL
jgi:hypothetical protein